MKKKLIVSILLIIFTFTVIGCSKNDTAYVAKVDGTIITQEQLDKRLEQAAAMYNFDIEDPKLADTKDMLALQVLEGMIEETLLVNEAKKRNIKISDEDFQKELKTIKAQFKSDKEYTEALKTNMKMTEKEFEALLKDQMLMEALIEDVTKDIKTTEAETKKYYDEHQEEFRQEEQIKARHILVKTEEEAQEIIKQIVDEGKDFAQIASLKSTGPSAKDGGDLGYFGRGAMVKPFEDAAFNLEIGEVTKIPVQTQFGYHVIKVEDKKEAKQLTFDEVKEDVESKITYEAKQEAFLKFKEELRKDAQIENKLADKIKEEQAKEQEQKKEDKAENKQE